MIRAIMLMLSVTPLVSAVPLPRDSVRANFFPLTKGNSWVYHNEGTEDAQDFTVTVMEASERNERITAQLQSKFCTHLQDESLISDVTGVYHLTKPKPIAMLRYPLVMGSRWESLLTGEDEPEAVAEVMGMREIQVPAGKFRTVEVRFTSKLHGSILTRTVWYAQNVGVVKQTYRSGEAQNTIVLKSFTSGKPGE